MFDEILFPTDGSDGAAAALDHVLELAERHESTVHVINVADTTRDSLTHISGEVVDALEERGEDIVQQAADRVRNRRLEVVTEILQGEPNQTIVEYADSREIDLIILPTHGRRGLKRYLLGSTTERVVRRSNVPVLTLRPAAAKDSQYPYEDVLVPTDGSAGAKEALSIGVDVTLAGEALLHLLSVITTTSLGVDVRSDIMKRELEASAEHILEEAAEFATDAGVESPRESVEYGASIHKVILSYIDDHDIDLVVVGTHGRTGLERYMIGSVTDYLIRTAPIPVLTVRRREDRR